MQLRATFGPSAPWALAFSDVMAHGPVKSNSAVISTRTESRRLSWGRSAFAVSVAVILIGLGLANISTRLRMHEVEDGVLWSARPEGVTALAIAPDSAADQAGIAPGDVLVAVNGAPVELPARCRVLERSFCASAQSARMSFSLV